MCFPTLGKNTKDLDCFAIFKLLFFMFYPPDFTGRERQSGNATPASTI